MTRTDRAGGRRCAAPAVIAGLLFGAGCAGRLYVDEEARAPAAAPDGISFGGGSGATAQSLAGRRLYSESTTFKAGAGSMSFSDGADLALQEVALRTQREEEKTPGERVMIYNAELELKVQNLDVALERARALVEELGGYLAERDGETLTVRVPAAKYREGLDALAALGSVVSRRENVADVTEEYFDLKTRLDNQIALQKRLQALLERAETVEAILEVERELSRVNEEIEILKGKLQRLDNQVAFSTITVAFVRIAPLEGSIGPVLELPFSWLRELRAERLFQN